MERHAGQTGHALATGLTNTVDIRLRQRMAAHHPAPHWTVVAVGGYGRGDLCPHSDIDILILLGKRTPAATIEHILATLVHPLWNEGLAPSYSVRRVKEALADARHDFFLQTALLDARLVAGAQAPFEELAHRLSQHWQGQRARRRFVEDLRSHNAKRHAEYGDAAYVLEPDLKDGQGGLRDYHGLRWMTRVVLGSQNLSDLESAGDLHPLDRQELEQAVELILQVRQRLHILAGRKNDRLFFEHQETIAQEMAFPGCNLRTAVETFMRRLHRATLTIKSVCEAASLSLQERLDPPVVRNIDQNFLLRDERLSFTADPTQPPHQLMRIFACMAATGKALHPMARAALRANIALVPRLQNDPAAKAAFLATLQGPAVEKALTAMLETGVLAHFIPEFERIVSRIQYDVYHTFTVDMHSIHTVSVLCALPSEPQRLFARLPDRTVLLLAALLHDIGKGYGRDHAKAGAPIAYTIARRFDLGRASAEEVRFLVQQHLLLAHTALRRDLSEEKAIISFAGQVADPQRLTKLYLLTLADTSATGPMAMSAWKAALFQELYHKAQTVLEKGDLRDPQAIRSLERTWKQLIQTAPESPVKRPAGRLWALPQAYVLAFSAEDILTHLRLAEAVHGAHDLILDLAPVGERFILTLITRDRPGLFASLTGILAYRHINIHAAKIFTWDDGLAVDVFEVSPPWEDYHDWERIPELFLRVTKGELDLAHAVQKTKPLLKDAPRLRSHERTRIVFDNTSSDFFTLIEVYAPDRIGLLYAIAGALAGSELDIHRAFISNKGDLAADIFYVVDSQGEKVEDPVRQREIEVGIQNAVP